jgi:hypothetical protein
MAPIKNSPTGTLLAQQEDLNLLVMVGATPQPDEVEHQRQRLPEKKEEHGSEHCREHAEEHRG